MRRGEIWTLSAGGPYTGKPRPALILRNDFYEDLPAVTLCVFTSSDATPDVDFIRPLIRPDDGNGLVKESRLMVDKITTVRKNRLGRRIGHISARDMRRVEQVLLVYLGLA